MDLGFFYDDLAPYGHWIERPQYGWVWTPAHVASSWRPYQHGHWVWTVDGWAWISDEPFGWATYHYGRWYDDPDYGWGWVPGDKWAPAWVSWQEADDYVGWAPLPPYVDYRPGVTLNARLAADDYSFVPYDRFLSNRVYDYAAPRWESDRIYRQSRNVTRYGWQGNAIYNQGVSFDRVQRAVGRVPRYQVADLSFNQRRQGARFDNNRIAFFRPQVQRTARVAAPPDRPVARRSVLSARAAEQTFRNRQQERQVRQQQAQGVFQPQRQAQRGQRFEAQQNRQNRQITRQQQQQQERVQRQQQRVQQQQSRSQRQQQWQQDRAVRQQQERAQRQSRVERQQQVQQERSQRQQQRVQQQQSRSQRQQQWQQDRAVRQQQERAQRQSRVERQQQVQQERSQRQQQRVQQQQGRAQRQQQVQQERAQRQQPRFERQQQRQQQRAERQQQERPQRGNRRRPPQ